MDTTFAIQSGITYWIALGFEDQIFSFGQSDLSYILEFQPRRYDPDIEILSPRGKFLKDGSSKLDFGRVEAGRRGKSQTYVIRNQGKAPLTGITLRSSGKAAAERSAQGQGHPVRPDRRIPQGDQTR